MTEYTRLQDVIQDYRAIKVRTEQSHQAYVSNTRLKALTALQTFNFIQGRGALTKASKLLGESKSLLSFYINKYGRGVINK